MSIRIKGCRLCGNEHLVTILDLGVQAMTGVFPREPAADVGAGPLELVKCTGVGSHVCGLVQLAHSFQLATMYGANYGYRSGLNASMVRHLRAKVARVLERIPLRNGDLIVDIGSNDGTTLSFYPEQRFDLVGVDPTIEKFGAFYPPHIAKIAHFFSGDVIRRQVGRRRARVVTSLAMFYDLEAPLAFARDVLSLLEEDGVWITEQSYLPTMLATNSYDTVCHEHLEYYGLTQIKWMLDRLGAKVVDVEFNNVNGGSVSLWITRRDAPQPEYRGLADVLTREREAGLEELEPYRAFAERAAQSREDIRVFFDTSGREGKTVGGLGASTKGNVLLQYCNVGPNNMFCIGEVNPDKFGCYTPGSLIPIVPERELIAQNPCYLFVLPWHFRDFFRMSEHLKGQRLVFPLPKLEIVQ